MASDSPSAAPRPSPRASSPGFWLLVAVLFSLAGHAALWFWFLHASLPYSPIPSREKLLLRKFKLERVEIHSPYKAPDLPAPTQASPTPSPDRSSLAPAEEKRTFAKLLADAPTAPTLPAGAPPIPQDKPEPGFAQAPVGAAESSVRPRLDQALQSASEQQLRQGVKPGAGRPILPTPGAPVAPKAGSADLAAPMQPKIGPDAGPVVGAGGAIFSGAGRLDDFFGPGGLPPPAEKPKLPDAAALAPQSLLKDKPVAKEKLDSLNRFLNVELFTTERQVSGRSPEGYFLIRITAKPNQQLSVIPKDVFFVLDISSSIGGKRLAAFTSAVQSAVGQLNAGDRFKLMVFRSKLEYFRPGWSGALSQSPRDADDLKKWLAALDTGGVTDFYDGLRPLTEYRREHGRTSLALVLSDGIPTTGVLDSTTIISELSQANEASVSIFSMSTGREVNNFLLDFLAYCNQGRLRHVPKIEQAAGRFAEFSAQVRDPLFTDPRFRVAGSGVDPDQVYPKNLPNLYQDLPLLLFGRYTPHQTERITLQVLGESLGGTKELLVELPLPKVPNGPEILPSSWAQQRIYHLLGQMTRSRVRQDPILDQVRALSGEYKVEVPYF